MNIENSQTVQIVNTLHDVGVPVSLLGYGYLKEAIALAISDKSYISAITKRLYPMIAVSNNTTPSRVERAIRHAIESGWGRGDIDTKTSYFGNTVQSNRGKPTNAEFIATLTEAIELRNLEEADQ